MSNMVLSLLSNAFPQLASLNQIASTLRAASNPLAALNNLAQTDPRMHEAATMINQNGGNVQQLVYNLAQQKGVNVQDVLNQARSMM